MTTRDLTIAYLIFRCVVHRKLPEAHSNNAATTGLIYSGHVDTTQLAIAPFYVQVVNEISSDMNEIEAKIAALQQAHALRLRILFDFEAEQRKEAEIEIMTAEVTSMFNLCSLKIKKLWRQMDDTFPVAHKVRDNIQRGLATRLQCQSEGFKNVQKAYMRQVDEMPGEGFDGLMPSRPVVTDKDTGFSDQQMSALANAEDDVGDRIREIQHIARSVEQLAGMFKELSALVVDQGTILDRIDHNMEAAVKDTIKGKDNLVDANKLHKSSRPIKCMAALMGLIVTGVVVIVAKVAPA